MGSVVRRNRPTPAKPNMGRNNPIAVAGQFIFFPASLRSSCTARKTTPPTSARRWTGGTRRVFQFAVQSAMVGTLEARMKRPPKTGPFMLPIMKDVLTRGEPAAPSIEDARVRLGGPYPDATLSDSTLVGAKVWVQPKVGAVGRLAKMPAIVLIPEGERWDIWLGGGRVGRMKPAELVRRAKEEDGTPWEALEPVASAIRRFALLEEGASVSYASSADEEGHGTLKEKCRYGALVIPTGETRVMAVGFQQLRGGRPGPSV